MLIDRSLVDSVNLLELFEVVHCLREILLGHVEDLANLPLTHFLKIAYERSLPVLN